MPAFVPTSVVTIQRFAGAMFGLQIGSVTMGTVQGDIGTNGIGGLNLMLNSYYTSAVGNTTTVQVAASVLTNLGIVTGQFGLTAAQVQGASDYIVGILNSNPSARGVAIASILESFSRMTSDSAYGAVATAFNTNTANAVTWGQTSPTDKLIGAPGVFNLTTAVTTTTGTAGNDVFIANVADNSNTFQSGDVIVGGAGKDMLYATLGNSSAFAITATTSSVEQAVFRSQSINALGSNGGNNVTATGQKNTVDAERMVGVNEYWNTDSRADLKIEDIRILDGQITKDITIVMRNTDPSSIGNQTAPANPSALNVGNVYTTDYEVYFSPESLRAANSVSTQAITVFVASQLQQGNALPGASYDVARPLANLPYDTLNITANGVAYTLKLDLVAAAIAGGHPGVGNLTEADFLYALKAAVLLASNGLATVSVNTQAYNYNSTDGAARSVNTYTITAPTFALGVPAANVWNASAGLPPTNAFAASAVQGTPVVTSPLVTSTIILDNVGREDEAGSLTIGGMDTRIGVERFEIKVASNDNNANNEHTSGSWISRAQSTNNVLKEVQITNVVATDNYHEAGIIDNRQVDADATANARTLAQITSNVLSSTGALVTAGNSDFLNIGTGTNQGGNNLNELRGFPTLLNADGLRDVRLFDALTFKGDIKLGAYFDAATIAKYQNLVDTAANDKTDNVAFVYTLGSGNDSLNVSIDPIALASNETIVAGRHDFNFTFNGMDGNDNIQVAIHNVNASGTAIGGIDGLSAFNYNQSLDKNVTIDGGNGDDVIRKPGAGNANLIGGAGNDVIYAENTGGSYGTYANAHIGTTASATDNLTNPSDDGIVGNDGFAKFVVNAQPDLLNDGITFPLENLRSKAPVTVNAVNAKVTVNFLGFSKMVDIGTSAGSLSNTVISDLTVNQAIKDAINNDSVLNKLLVAQDGPGHTLIVSSLIDGNMVAAAATPGVPANLSLKITLSGTALSASQLANTTLHQFNSVDFAAFGAASSGVYASPFASTNTATVLFTGADSIAASDNIITPGTGDDIVVLGTAGYRLASTSTNQQLNQFLGSNDSVVYSGYSNGNDTIVNFDTTVTTFAPKTIGQVTPKVVADEKVTLTFSDSDGTPTAETITFDGVTVTLSSATTGVIPAKDVAYQFAHGFGGSTNWSVTNTAGTDGTNTVQLTHAGSGIADLTSASFTGTYFGPAATTGGGTVGVVTTAQGVTPLVSGTAAAAVVTFTTSTTAATAAGTFTFDGTTISYGAGAGSLTLATLMNNSVFAHYDTVINTKGPDVTVTFTENALSRADTTAQAVATTTNFTGLTGNNVFGAISGASAGTASNGGEFTSAVIANTAAGAGGSTVLTIVDGQGFDSLDFTAYKVGAAYVGTSLVTSAGVAALTQYVQLVESTVQAGLYTVTVKEGGADGFGGAIVDTTVGTVGTINFGQHLDFAAHSFLI